VTLSDLELAARHKYKLLSGQVVASVTQISGSLDLGKSGAFAGAAVKLTKAGINYRTEWAARAERGTRIHGHMEAWLRGEAIEQLDEDAGYVDALEKFILEHDLEVLESEQVVLSSRGFGGRFDLIARIGSETALLDLKSGSAYPVEASLQLSAYRYADGIASYDEDGTLFDLRPVPTVDWCACVYVRGDGTYRVARYPADETAFAAFCHLLDAFKWANSPEMKSLTQEAKK
jgi:hypothetical protein